MDRKIMELEEILWIRSAHVVREDYARWVMDYDLCVSLLEKQIPDPQGPWKLTTEGLKARIERLNYLRNWTFKRIIRAGVSAPALSTNTPVNSIVQAIRGREIGLKKSMTKELEGGLFGYFDSVPFDILCWRAQQFYGTELNRGSTQQLVPGYLQHPRNSGEYLMGFRSNRRVLI